MQRVILCRPTREAVSGRATPLRRTVALSIWNGTLESLGPSTVKTLARSPVVWCPRLHSVPTRCLAPTMQCAWPRNEFPASVNGTFVRRYSMLAHRFDADPSIGTGFSCRPMAI